MTHTCLITGATGIVGSHLAEACKARGMTVRALVRSTSETQFLRELGVELTTGDLTDADSLRRAMVGVDHVFHCAAKVGDWGPVEEYRAVNVESLRAMLETAPAGLKRFVYLGSLGVYPARHHYGSDESEPLPEKHFDGYTQSKVEAEKLALQYHRERGIPVVVLRPGFIYGPRDRTVFPPLVNNLRARRVRYMLGGRKRLMNCIYVLNLVEAFFLAIEKDEAVGQAFNLTDGEAVTKQRFLETICAGLNLPRPRPIPAPLFLARWVARWMEHRARKRGDTQAPTVTMARVKFIGLNLHFSIDKARRLLGYSPRYGFDEAMKTTLEWFRAHPEALPPESVS